MKRITMLVPALLLGLGVGGFAVTQAFAQSNPYTLHQAYASSNSATNSSWGNDGFGGMMGGYFGGNGGNQNNWFHSMVSIMDQYYGPISKIKAADANATMQSSLQNATVDKTDNTITYSGKTVKIVVFGGAMDNSKSGAAEKFVIGGLVNPTLQISKGAQVTLELINEDTNMPHGIEVTDVHPPYWFMSMMQGGIYPGTFIPPIPEANSDSYAEASTTFTASQTGTFQYICEYPGHAAEGMYGEIIVR